MTCRFTSSIPACLRPMYTSMHVCITIIFCCFSELKYRHVFQHWIEMTTDSKYYHNYKDPLYEFGKELCILSRWARCAQLMLPLAPLLLVDCNITESVNFTLLLWSQSTLTALLDDVLPLLFALFVTII